MRFFKAYHLSLKTLLNYQTTISEVISEVKKLMQDSSKDFSDRNLTIIILKLIKSDILVLENKNGTYSNNTTVFKGNLIDINLL